MSSAATPCEADTPAAEATSGAAKRARARKVRAEARRVVWLATNYQQILARHTSNAQVPGHTPPGLVCTGCAALQRRIEALEGQLSGLFSPAHGSHLHHSRPEPPHPGSEQLCGHLRGTEQGGGEHPKQEVKQEDLAEEVLPVPWAWPDMPPNIPHDGISDDICKEENEYPKGAQNPDFVEPVATTKVEDDVGHCSGHKHNEEGHSAKEVTRSMEDKDAKSKTPTSIRGSQAVEEDLSENLAQATANEEADQLHYDKCKFAELNVEQDPTMQQPVAPETLSVSPCAGESMINNLQVGEHDFATGLGHGLHPRQDELVHGGVPGDDDGLMARRIASYTIEQVEKELDELLADDRQPSRADQVQLRRLLARESALQAQGHHGA